MRELRFRAWVYYGENLKKPHYSRDYDSLDRFFEDHSEDDIDQCIEQYTGLKDKNGKEIYEGDIVRYFDDEEQIIEAVIKQNDGDTENSYWISGIVYEPLHIVSEEDLTEEEYENLCGFEVIGNIHENP